MADTDPATPGAPPDDRHRLERAPGERYASRAGGAGPTAGPPAADGPAGHGLVRSLLVADAVALGGALVIFALGLVDLGVGLLAASAAVGWAVALALVWRGDGLPDRRARMVAAALLAAAAIVLGYALNWAWARMEGGVLDLLAYLDQRYGALALANVLVAAIVAAWRAR